MINRGRGIKNLIKGLSDDEPPHELGLTPSAPLEIYPIAEETPHGCFQVATIAT
jgi:hypothetical protein